MKILIAVTSIIVFFLFKVSAQTASDSIFYIETLNGYHFIFQNQPISANEVSALMENNFEAYDAFESGREAKIFGYVFFTIGSGLIVYPFVTSILGKETNWALTFAGMGFVGLSIPIFHNYHHKTLQAVELYNGGLAQPNSGLYNKSLYLGLTSSGLGLVYKF